MFRNFRTTPVLGTSFGIAFGVLLGSATVYYFEVSQSLDIFCVITISTLAFQLFGATVGGAMGRSHLQVGSTRPGSEVN